QARSSGWHRITKQALSNNTAPTHKKWASCHPRQVSSIHRTNQCTPPSCLLPDGLSACQPSHWGNASVSGTTPLLHEGVWIEPFAFRPLPADAHAPAAYHMLGAVLSTRSLQLPL